VKITALTEHECICCEGTIKKGEECFVWFMFPEDPNKAEFKPIYTCKSCVEKELCRDKLRGKGITALR